MKLPIPATRETCLSIVILMSTVILSQQQDPCRMTGGGYEYFLENIMENTPVGSDLGQLPVEGSNDQVTLTPNDHEFLSFNNETRVISLNKTLSVDQGAPEIPKFFIDCLPKVDNSRSIQIIVRLIVIDYNNNVPTFNRVHHNTSISEAADVGTVVYAGASATDNDKQYIGNSQIIYSIVPGNYSEYFALTAATSPEIILARELDYETVTQMIVELKAEDRPTKDQPTLSSTATITVNIEDADDLVPEFTYRMYFGSVAEDAGAGTYVKMQTQVEASDKDSMNVSVVYRLLDPYDMFEIDPVTGKVRYIGPLREGLRTVTVVVLAAQIDSPLREGFAFVLITITEANINAPKFSQTLYEVTKSEYELVNSTLVSASATDPDFGTVLRYELVEETDDLSVDQSGNIILLQPLDYEIEREKTVRVTASDGTHTATATVKINIADVNDNNPVLTIDKSLVDVNREEGLVLTTVTATDADVNNVLTIVLRSHENLFAINAAGEVYIVAPPEDLLEDTYGLLITALDDGYPPRQSSSLLTVKFPPSGVVRTTQTAAVRTKEEDDMLPIILGAVAGVLLVVILIMAVYIIWKHRRTKEELDKARIPHGHSAKGLTYRQAEAPDDLPKMDLRYGGETDDSEFGGSTTIQENPLRSTAVNEAYLQSSGSEMDRDVSEIEIETAVVPYDEEDFGYPSGRSPYVNNHIKTFKGGEDSTSTESSQSDSTGGSRRGLVNGVKQNSNKMTSWDSDDKLHPQGAQKLLASEVTVTSGKPKKEKPEITVYF